MNSNIIEARSISKFFYDAGDAFCALQDINLTVKEGEFVAIVGPSGAGKSTLLHILAGLDTPTEGKVFFKGQDLFRKFRNTYKVRNAYFGFVFQFYYLINELSL